MNTVCPFQMWVMLGNSRIEVQVWRIKRLTAIYLYHDITDGSLWYTIQMSRAMAIMAYLRCKLRRTMWSLGWTKMWQSLGQHHRRLLVPPRPNGIQSNSAGWVQREFRMPGATLNYDTLTQVNGAVGSGAMPPLIVQMHIKVRRYQGSTSATLVALAYGVAANHWIYRYTFCIFLLEIFGAKMMLLVLDAIGFLMFLVGLLAFLASHCTYLHFS